MECEKVRRFVLENQPESPFPDPVAAHVTVCASCQRVIDEHRDFWRKLDEMTDIEPSSDFRASVWKRIHAVEKKREHRAPRVRWMVWAWSAAACILLAAAVWFQRPTVSHVEKRSTTKTPITILNVSTDQQDDALLADVEGLLQSEEIRFLEIYQPWPDSLAVSDPSRPKSKAKP